MIKGQNPLLIARWNIFHGMGAQSNRTRDKYQLNPSQHLLGSKGGDLDCGKQIKALEVMIEGFANKRGYASLLEEPTI